MLWNMIEDDYVPGTFQVFVLARNFPKTASRFSDRALISLQSPITH
jgi:hypothetical protein